MRITTGFLNGNVKSAASDTVGGLGANCCPEIWRDVMADRESGALGAASAPLDRFTPNEWRTAYQWAVLLWHQIEAANTSDKQKDIIAHTLLRFREDLMA